jgi:hypothetical protein
MYCKKPIILLSALIMVALAFGIAMVLASDGAEGDDGGGSVDVDRTWVYAGQRYELKFTYTCEDDLTGTNPGFKVTIPETDLVEYPTWNPEAPAYHGWTSPQTADDSKPAYCWVSDIYNIEMTNYAISFEDGDGHTYNDRRIVVTFSAPLPVADQVLVLHYGGGTINSDTFAQRHIEDDVFFRVQSDENGDGTYADTDDEMENPNIDVFPFDPNKLIMTITEDQTYDPDPYQSPTQYHDTEVISDKTAGVPFDVEFRLVDIYGNPQVDWDSPGDDSLIRIRGAGISPCEYYPVMTDKNLIRQPFYTDLSETQNDIDMWFIDGRV